MGALGEDGALVPADVLDAEPAGGGDLLGRLTRADARLDVTGAQLRLHLDLQLAQPGPVAAHGGAQRLVHPQPETAAVGADEHDVLSVVVDPDEPQVLHVGRPPGSVVRAIIADALCHLRRHPVRTAGEDEPRRVAPGAEEGCGSG